MEIWSSPWKCYVPFLVSDQIFLMAPRLEGVMLPAFSNARVPQWRTALVNRFLLSILVRLSFSMDKARSYPRPRKGESKEIFFFQSLACSQAFTSYSF